MLVSALEVFSSKDCDLFYVHLVLTFSISGLKQQIVPVRSVNHTTEKKEREREQQDKLSKQTLD